MADNNYPKVVTPRGTSIYPKLNTPDTKFKAEGVYEVKLAFDAETVASEPFQKLQSRVDELIEAKRKEQEDKLVAAGKKGLVSKLKTTSPFKPEEDGETGDETGRIIVKAKMTASGVSKKTGKPWKRKPTIFDAKGKKIENPPQIGGGTEMKLSVELFPYFNEKDKEAGVSFRLEAAQILKLVVFGSRDAAGFGFSEEDGDELESCDEEFGAGAEDSNGGDEDDGL